VLALAERARCRSPPPMLGISARGRLTPLEPRQMGIARRGLGVNNAIQEADPARVRGSACGSTIA